ncbi:MAG: bifunctional riboflavin kinase/FAD synthetase [Oscillospiraceae bacterium]
MKTEKSIALGTFDGFHKGHLEVINEAKNSKYKPFVLLFSEHPQMQITGKSPDEILTKTIRKNLLQKINVDSIIIDFNEIKNMTPQSFFCDIIIDRFNAKELSCGENYSFGKGGKGDAKLLKELCDENGIKLNIAKTIKYNNKTISSTLIRQAIRDGKIEQANEMLGRCFSYDFEVRYGDERGKTLGFPTINQFFDDGFIEMKHGVYASFVLINEKKYPSVTNFGKRPTIGTKTVRSETHIIGFEGDLYGQNIEVSILSYIRPEKEFNDFKELSNAIKNDAQTAMRIFKNSI